MKRYIAGLMLGCDKARHGELSEGEMDDLAEECRGLEHYPIFGRSISLYASERNWSALMGAMAPLMQDEAGGVSVSNVNSSQSRSESVSKSTATAIASSSYGEAVGAVEGLDLDEGGKEALLDLLNEARKSSKDETLAKHALKALIDKAFDLGVDALKAVLPYVWGVLMSITGAA